ncbi:hypothetical protein A2U01_0029686, partial [Trifolium medium]|nr:hypothetical protein [Trifolium medium]
MSAEFSYTRAAPLTSWVQRLNHQALGYVDLIVTDQRDCKIDQGSVPGRGVPFSILVHPRLDNYCRFARCTLYCSPENEILHEQGTGRYSARGHKAARRCFEAATKGHNYVSKAPSSSKKPKPTLQLPAPNVSSVDLDSRYSKKEHKEENKLRKENKESDEASKEIPRPIPDGEFELVLLGEDPSKGVKIGTGLPDLAKEQLKPCLRENADLFAWSATEMPDLDPKVACHQLTIDPAASVVV